MTREEAINEIKSWAIPSKKGREVLETLIPELRESEEERIRKEIIEFIQWSEDRGMTRHDFHQAKRPSEWIAYLEKQKEPHYTKRNTLFDKCVENCDPEIMKEVSNEIDSQLKKEQKLVEPSDEELQRHQDELYNFKVFAAKQAKEHHISYVHDFEWDNFCAEILSYFNEQKPAEWSEEDEKNRRNLMSLLANMRGDRITEETYQKYYPWLKDLCPSWKPSEEQMQYLLAVINDPNNAGAESCHLILKSLYNDLKKLI